MALRKASGLRDRRHDQEPREIDRFGRRIDLTDSAQDEAEQAVAAMLANGATFHPQSRTDGLQAFTYEVAGSGDLERCREILREVKAKPADWAAMVRLVCAGVTAGAHHGR